MRPPYPERVREVEGVLADGRATLACEFGDVLERHAKDRVDLELRRGDVNAEPDLRERAAFQAPRQDASDAQIHEFRKRGQFLLFGGFEERARIVRRYCWHAGVEARNRLRWQAYCSRSLLRLNPFLALDGELERDDDVR